MRQLKPILMATALGIFAASSALAKPSVNDVQQCQAVLDFTVERINSVKKYTKADQKTVTSALNTYNAFLQSEHVDPGLLEFTKGDKAAAKEYQTQIDAYKKTLISALKSRHPQAQIFTDQAVAINNCYTAAPMGDDKTPMMKTALETIIKLAKQG